VHWWELVHISLEDGLEDVGPPACNIIA